MVVSVMMKDEETIEANDREGADQAYADLGRDLSDAWKGQRACERREPVPGATTGRDAADQAHEAYVQALSRSWQGGCR